MTDTLPQVGRATAAAAAMFKENQVQRTAGGGAPYLTYDAKRTGEWLLGPEKEPVTGDIFSLDVSTLQHGYIQWHNKKSDTRMVAINQPLPEPHEPIHYEIKGKPEVDEASEARSFEGTLADGDKFLFETSTFGGRKAVDNMMAELFTRANANNPFLFPQVKLDTNSYEHKTYGKTFEPVLVAVAWFDEDGNQEEEQQQLPLDEPAEELTAEEETPTPAPTRRRRRQG